MTHHLLKPNQFPSLDSPGGFLTWPCPRPSLSSAFCRARYKHSHKGCQFTALFHWPAISSHFIPDPGTPTPDGLPLCSSLHPSLLSLLPWPDSRFLERPAPPRRPCPSLWSQPSSPEQSPAPLMGVPTEQWLNFPWKAGGSFSLETEAVLFSPPWEPSRMAGMEVFPPMN